MSLSWIIIKASYPDEYVVLAHPQSPQGSPLELQSGEVVAHGPVLDDVLNHCDLTSFDSYAIRYTGDLGMAIGERGMLRVIEQA